ncbi:hypothetical protein T440DRAFT_559854 [Plenodomus tracheiphilus IPT5]|uniref:Uncharacterized protein n=1 Tax=Plenodomus tracheiphilus IPT5 TaxID=1408161 RepID=A0A6A7ALX2_9PLEO|nr:hypothetical protein T440DRAFT_559854 [Plenodomus tracheiphilus IPT5]
MATQEQEPQMARASVASRKLDDWTVYLCGKPLPGTPDNKEATIPPTCGVEVNQPVWTLAESPLAMKEEHPEDAEIIRRLQVLSEERSSVGQNFSRVAEASGRLCGIMRDSNSPPE